LYEYTETGERILISKKEDVKISNEGDLLKKLEDKTKKDN